MILRKIIDEGKEFSDYMIFSKKSKKSFSFFRTKACAVGLCSLFFSRYLEQIFSMKQSLPVVLMFFLALIFAGTACTEGAQDSPDIRKETFEEEVVPEPKESEETSESKPKISKSTEGFGDDYENQNRVIWQKPEMILDMMGDLSHKTVADIGAGTGHFALRLARKAERVIAVDIDKKFTEYIDSVKVMELPDRFQDRLITRLATESDPKLQSEEADYAVVVNTYMYVGDRIAWTKKVMEGLKPGGKLMVIDFKRKRTPVGPPSTYRVPLFVVEEEMTKSGLINIQTNDAALDYQYIVVGEKR